LIGRRHGQVLPVRSRQAIEWRQTVAVSGMANIGAVGHHYHLCPVSRRRIAANVAGLAGGVVEFAVEGNLQVRARVE
jgi:hypothetical protein